MKTRGIFSLISTAIFLFLFGCSLVQLLPSSTEFTEAKWESYEEIESLYLSVKKGETEEQLREKGIHPRLIPMGVISDITIRNKYLPNESIKIEYLDEGVRECMEAKGKCFGYEFYFEKTNEKREGSFWLDTLGIKRESLISGWKFEGRILLVKGEDDRARVVYIERPGGNPIVKKQTKTIKTLWPVPKHWRRSHEVGNPLHLLVLKNKKTR